MSAVYPWGANQTLTSNALDAAISGRMLPDASNVTLPDSRTNQHIGPYVDVRDFGAVCNGVANDTAAVNSAATLASTMGWPLSTGGLLATYSGTFTIPNNVKVLRDFRLKQLTPNPASTRTILKNSGTGPLLLERVFVDRNGVATDGSISSPAAGIYIQNINDVTLIDVEVTGNSFGLGIFIGTGSRIKLVRPYVHDMAWSAGADPGSEQTNGIFLSGLTDVDLDNPVITNITGSISGGPFLPYQTDGLDISGCTNVTVRGGTIANCGEGADVSGSGTNSNIWFYGTTFRNCGSYGLKFVHDVRDSGSVGCRGINCGFAGWIVAGGNAGSGDAAGPSHIRIDTFTSDEPGYNGLWSGANVIGGGVLADTLPATDVVATNCVANSRLFTLLTGAVLAAGSGFVAGDYGPMTGTGLVYAPVIKILTLSGSGVATFQITPGSTPKYAVNQGGQFTTGPATLTMAAGWLKANGVTQSVGTGFQIGTTTYGHSMLYGFRNESGDVTNLTLLNPSITGAATASYLGFTSGYRPALPTATFKPDDPAGTTSASAVTMGLASGATVGQRALFTPTQSGTVEVTIRGSIRNTVLGDGTQVSAAFGSGSAPANGVANPGTQIPGNIERFSASVAGGNFAPFCVVGFATGMVLNTIYWFDALLTKTGGGAGTASILDVTVTFKEL